MSITLPLIMLPIDRWPPPPLGDGPEDEEVLVGEESLEEEPFLDEPEVPARGSTPPPLVVPALALSLLLLDDEGP